MSFAKYYLSLIKSSMLFQILYPLKSDMRFLEQYYRILVDIAHNVTSTKARQLNILCTIILLKCIESGLMYFVKNLNHKIRMSLFDFIYLNSSMDELKLAIAALYYLTYYSIKSLHFNQNCLRSFQPVYRFLFQPDLDHAPFISDLFAHEAIKRLIQIHLNLFHVFTITAGKYKLLSNFCFEQTASTIFSNEY